MWDLLFDRSVVLGLMLNIPVIALVGGIVYYNYRTWRHLTPQAEVRYTGMAIFTRAKKRCGRLFIISFACLLGSLFVPLILGWNSIAMSDSVRMHAHETLTVFGTALSLIAMSITGLLYHRYSRKEFRYVNEIEG